MVCNADADADIKRMRLEIRLQKVRYRINLLSVQGTCPSCKICLLLPHSPAAKHFDREKDCALTEGAARFQGRNRSRSTSWGQERVGSRSSYESG